MNTFTQQQMTTGRNALGLSLLAGKVFASFEPTGKAQAGGDKADAFAYAGGSYQPRKMVSADFREQPGFCRHRREHALHIRGGHP